MPTDGSDTSEQLEIVADRIEFLELLAGPSPLATRDVVDAVEHSRSTVTRALRELREADLIEKISDGYVTTRAGVKAAEQYRRYEAATHAILDSKELLAPLPESYALPVDLLVDATTISVDEQVPVRALEAVSNRVRNADTARGYLPTLLDTHLLRVWHRAVVDGAGGAAILAPDLLAALKGQYPGVLSGMATTAGFSAGVAPGPPYAVFLTTRDEETTVTVVVYGDDTAVRGVVTNATADAVEWARGEFQALEQEATDVTADLEALDAAVDESAHVGRRPEPNRDPVDEEPDDGAADRDFPLALEMEGFVRLSEQFFETHSRAPPAVSWRTGFTLAEVRAGHAVDRRDDDGRNLTQRLLDRLQDGVDHAVLGVPGAGKSTVSMAVACEWFDRGLGPVLYRQRGRNTFESTALLEAYLRQTEGHALVVVEDAVREEAGAVFAVMQALDGAPDVTFLLDARTGEWNGGDDASLDARREAYRRAAIEQVTVPELTETECERFVDQFERLVGADVGLSGAELFSLVAEGPGTGEAGEALIAQHHLSMRYDPVLEPAVGSTTALDESVQRTYRTLADHDTRFALDLAVLASLLAAAGVPVAREYLHAVTVDEEYAALERALSVLKGRLLFDSTQLPSEDASPTTYRTRHETWSVRFLECVREIETTQTARRRFGRCVTQLLSLADDADRRGQLRRHLDGRTPHLHRIDANPTGWADEIVRRLFGVSHTASNLAPLFGETTDTAIELPENCSAWTTVQQAYWRGLANRIHGELDRAEREFRTLRERADAVDLTDEPGPRTATAGPSSGGTPPEFDRGDAWPDRWRALAAAELGIVARKRGNLETAAEYHEESLAVCRDAGDRHGEATALKNLGNVAYRRGDLETAEARYEEGLARYRELEDHEGEAMVLFAFGNVASDRGDLAAAEAHYEESLARYREGDDPRREALPLVTLGIVARERGDLATAADYCTQSLARYREVGDQQGEATALRELGMVASERGDLEGAAQHLEESLMRYREVGDRQSAAHALTYLGRVARRRGDLEAAARHLEESLAVCRDASDRHGEATALLELGELALARDDLEDARTRFAAAAERCLEMGAGEATTALDRVVDVCQRQGNTDAATAWCRRAVDFAERTDRPETRDTFAARRAELAGTE